MPPACRVDLHVKVLDEAVAARAKARGLSVLVYAPHFTRLPAIASAADRFTDEDLLVVPGREIFTGTWRDRRHVLALGLTAPIPDFLTLEATMAELDRQDATVLVPHPEFATVSLDRADIERYRDRIHAIETDNAKHLRVHSRRARAIVRETGIPPFASSYAHLRGTVGEIWTTFERPLESGEELLTALRSGERRRTDHRTGFEHRLRRAMEVAHLGYENSWQKLDRVVLSGREPTHPEHPAYEGRFDAGRAY